MSAKATFWAWSLKGLKSSQKLVLLCLADNHNGESGQCNPSVAFIADKTGLNRKTILQALSDLERVGLIRAQKRFGTTTNFRLLTSTNFGTGGDGSKTQKAGKKAGETSTENGTGSESEEAQKAVPETGPVPNSGPVPKTDTTSTVFTKNQYQKRDTEPKTEPTKNLKPSERERTRDEKFRMSLDWIPDEALWFENCQRAGCDPNSADVLHEFRLYWSGEARSHTEHQWQGKLLNQLKRQYQKTRILKTSPHGDTTRERSLIQDLTDRSWAEDGT